MLPNLSDYMQTFQNPGLFLSDRVLASCTCPKDQQGQPEVQSGGFALTFRLVGSSKKWAVRCFHREVKDRDRRYTAISAMLNQPTMRQSEYFVDFAYQAKGVMVKGQWYPVVKMAWAQGETLGSFLESNYNNRQAMLNLRKSLQKLYQFLSANHVAHGDIQPGNLMVSNNGQKIQLIDYDGMFVPGMQGLSASETGVPNFQHPCRQKDNPWNDKLDRFPFIILDIALTVLAERPEYWTKTKSSDEKVLFETTDYAAPYGFQTFNELKADGRFSQQISALQQICLSDFDSIPELDKYLQFKLSPSAAAKKQPSVVKISYKGNFPVFDATNLRLIAGHVGDVVELVGKIVETKANTTSGGGRFGNRPYMFVNFNYWRPRTDTVRLVLWSEVLNQFLRMGVPSVSSRLKNQYVTVTGMICAFTNQFGTSYQLVPKTATQIQIIDEKEAAFRLGRIQKEIQQKFGGTVAAPTSQPPNTGSTSRSNVDRLKGLGTSARATPTHPGLRPISSRTPSGSGMRRSTSSLSTRMPTRAMARSRVTVGSIPYTPPPPPPPPPPRRPQSNVDRLKALTSGVGSGKSVRTSSGSSTASPTTSRTPSTPAPSRPNSTGGGCCLWIVVIITVITVLGKIC